MYYHVRIDYFDKHLKVNQTLFGYDYAIDTDIRNNITEPFVREKDFYFKGVKLQAVSIRQLQVFKSENSINQCCDYVNRLNPSNFIDYSEEDLLPYENLVIDITNEIIKSTQNYIEEWDNRENKHSTPINKAKKIFICHAGANSNAANKLVTFLKLMGVPSDSIFCSSTLGNDFEVSENFVKGLHDLFEKNQLYVIILHSQEFYSRPICLNEMGAAWATNCPVFSIILRGCDQNIMKGVVRPDEIAIMVDKQKHAIKHLNDLKKQISNFLGIAFTVDEDQWDNNRFELLADLESLSSEEEEPQRNEHSRFTPGYGKPVPIAPNMNPHMK